LILLHKVKFYLHAGCNLTAQSTRTGLLCVELHHFSSRKLAGSSGSIAPASPAGYLVNVRVLT